MGYFKRNGKRVAIDALGYLLIIVAIPIGWIPGPGGLPVFVAGLGLLSINNVWAQKLRDYLLRSGGKFSKLLFPPNPRIELAYDIIAVLLWIVVAVLAWQHAAAWQIGLSVSLFFIATTIALLNRDRIQRLRRPKK